MQADSYTLIKYKPAFKAQVLSLQTHLWGRDLALNGAYLAWKYDQNPYANQAPIYLALCDREVVGMLGSFGVAWETGHGQLLKGLSLADLVIKPAHRNHGLLPKLLEFALADLAQAGATFVFDMTASPEVALVMLMNGWRSIYLQTAHRQGYPLTAATPLENSNVGGKYHQLRRYIKGLPGIGATVHTLRQAKQSLQRQRSKQGRFQPFGCFDTNQGQSKSPGNPHIKVAKAPEPVGMAALVARLPTDERFRHVRDAHYFTWRFQNPLSCYRFLFWQEAQIEGYLVLQTSVHARNDTAWVNIVDWEASDHRIGNALLQVALAWGDFKELEIWSATLPESMKSSLTEAGFTFRNRTGSAIRDVRGERLMIYALATERRSANWTLADHDALDLTNWDIRMVYSDAV
jgi:GNAT superfamily N-acetyltransferase